MRADNTSNILEKSKLRFWEPKVCPKSLNLDLQSLVPSSFQASLLPPGVEMTKNYGYQSPSSSLTIKCDY